MEHPIGPIRGERIVRDHDDRLPVVFRQGVQDLEHLVAGLAVEVARRLVGQDQARVAGDGPGDPDPLLLAAGELPGIVLEAIGQADDVEGRLDLPAPLLLASGVSSNGNSTLRAAVSIGSRL